MALSQPQHWQPPPATRTMATQFRHGLQVEMAHLPMTTHLMLIVGRHNMVCISPTPVVPEPYDIPQLTQYHNQTN